MPIVQWAKRLSFFTPFLPSLLTYLLTRTCCNWWNDCLHAVMDWRHVRRVTSLLCMALCQQRSVCFYHSVSSTDLWSAAPSDKQTPTSTLNPSELDLRQISRLISRIRVVEMSRVIHEFIILSFLCAVHVRCIAAANTSLKGHYRHCQWLTCTLGLFQQQ